jgi:serine/threonine-protein kinase
MVEGGDKWQARFVDPRGAKVGEYRIVRPIAWGGMGVIYLAENALLGTRAAAKVLREEFASDHNVVERFLEEASAASKIRHPNTVQIFDLVSLPDGRPCILMEYLEGETLERRAGRKPMPFARAKAILLQICSAVGETHARGIIHRDLKAENVLLVSREGRDDFVKLLDFGLAKSTLVTSHVLAAGVSLPGTLAGTPYSMAPEQVRGEPVDARTDIYALGVLAYRLLLGRFPFEGQSVEEVMHKHVNQAPDVSKLPGPLAAAISKALAKAREDRYSTVMGLAEALAPCSWDEVPSGDSGSWMLEPIDTPVPRPPTPKPQLRTPTPQPPAADAVPVATPEPSAPPPVEPAKPVVPRDIVEQYLERSDRDHYAFLGISDDAEAAVVRMACRRTEDELLEARAKAAAPLKAQVTALLGRLGRARGTLDDLETRAAYDARNGNYKGVASCLAAGLPAARLEKLRQDYAARFAERLARAAGLAVGAQALLDAKDIPGARDAFAHALSLDPLSADLHRRLRELPR